METYIATACSCTCISVANSYILKGRKDLHIFWVSLVCIAIYVAIYQSKSMAMQLAIRRACS